MVFRQTEKKITRIFSFFQSRLKNEPPHRRAVCEPRRAQRGLFEQPGGDRAAPTAPWPDRVHQQCLCQPQTPLSPGQLHPKDREPHSDEGPGASQSRDEQHSSESQNE